MINRYMRLILLYDLPVVTDRDKKIYNKFRNFLLDDGFYMIQYSVYVRICKNFDDVKKHITRVEINAPKKGNIRLFQLTEKQYENMYMISGNQVQEEEIDDSPLIIL